MKEVDRLGGEQEKLRIKLKEEFGSDWHLVQNGRVAGTIEIEEERIARINVRLRGGMLGGLFT
jgi:hypothetical protein